MASLTFVGSAPQAQTLPRPIPQCHSLPLSDSPDTECFDDTDRDREFPNNGFDQSLIQSLGLAIGGI